MAAWVTKHKAHIEDLITRMWSTKREITRAKDELKVKRSRRISMEDSFTVTLKEEVHKKVAEAIELAKIQAEEERERAIEMENVEYLAFDTFQVVKARCFL